MRTIVAFSVFSYFFLELSFPISQNLSYSNVEYMFIGDRYRCTKKKIKLSLDRPVKQRTKLCRHLRAKRLALKSRFPSVFDLFYFCVIDGCHK